MKRGRVHLIGVAGVAMAGVARLARELSWKVTGSDRAAWPPASERLARLGVDVRPFSEANLDPAPDYVVVGNAISRGHPELERALDEGLAILSMPEFLARFVLPGRKVAAICGTHGKTTTTAMLAWILDKAGMQPGFLIGGLPEGFEDGARLGRGEPFVIEGDEYDSAFFDKRSKFVHYRPRVAVLLNLEYDHADIFPDLEAIRAQFHQMIRTIPRNGLIVAAANEEIEKTLALGCWTPVRRFGQNAGDWRYTPLEADGSRFAIHAPDGATHTIQWSQIGAHLAANACAAIAAACEGFGVPFADACQAIAAWPGVRRRMTLLTEAQGVRIWEDFAHHPTAIRAVIAALAARRARERRGGTLWVVLEPASNTMRRKVHEQALPEALARADRVILLPPEPRGLAKAELLDVRAVAKALGARAQVAEDPKAGAAEIAQSLRPGDDVLLLSNASLRGVREALLRALSG